MRAGNKDLSDNVRPVLDYGFVRLVDAMGNDLSIVRAARVSHDAAWRTGNDQGSDHRLIYYLWKHKHTTPFESVVFTFEVKAPIFVLRQWHRHRTWSYNEKSARYCELPEEFYVPDAAAIGVQSKQNKQARIVGGAITDTAVTAAEAIRHSCEASFATYGKLLASGVPREVARSVLPVATYSHMFAIVNLLNLLKFLTLRCDPQAQYEIRMYAEAMHELITPIVPVAMAAWAAGNNK
jgi:thymidylate synthase (FAD)